MPKNHDLETANWKADSRMIASVRSASRYEDMLSTAKKGLGEYNRREVTTAFIEALRSDTAWTAIFSGTLQADFTHCGLEDFGFTPFKDFLILCHTKVVS